MKVGFVVDSKSSASVEAWQEISAIYQDRNIIAIDLEKNNKIDDLDVLVTLGGDGLMLHTLHQYMTMNIPIYGINRGSTGFLLNQYEPNKIFDLIENAKQIVIHPLMMEAISVTDQKFTSLAVNEVSLIRKTSQAAKIKISINQKTRMEQLIGDGILVSTAAGSTAYNLAAHGPVAPLNSNVLIVTPICPFRPRRWHGAIIASSSIIDIEILDANKRPVNSCADAKEFGNVKRVKIKEHRNIAIQLLFDPEKSFEEKLLQEQFSS